MANILILQFVTAHKNCIRPRPFRRRRFYMLAYFASKITAKSLNFSYPKQQERLKSWKVAFFSNSNDSLPLKRFIVFLTGALLIFHPRMRDKGWRVLIFVSLLFGVLKFRSLSGPKILLQLFEEEALFFRWINLM